MVTAQVPRSSNNRRRQGEAGADALRGEYPIIFGKYSTGACHLNYRCCADEAVDSEEHHVPVRVLSHIKKLEDCSGQFLVRLNCESIGSPVGRKMTLKELALRMR